MKFLGYCKDKWISFFIFAVVFAAGFGLLLLIGTPLAAACVVEGAYTAGFFLILLQDFLARKGFYEQVMEGAENLEEICYLSEFLTEPYFQEGRILYEILRRDEKYMNDRIAGQQQELQEYKAYVETWVHEIKTPVAVSRMIMENNRSDVTRSLSQEMDKVEGYIDQMLYYSKSSSLQEDYIIREVSLKEMVMSAVKAHSKAMITAKVPPVFENLDHMVLTDPKWMGFILGQIITNGVKYHSKGQKPELRFTAVREGSFILLSVSDNGIGMPAEDVVKVFRKGFTGSNGRKFARSTGMGLYLCDTLCRKLGTEISLTSKQGEGTKVTLRLAAAEKVKEPNITEL